MQHECRCSRACGDDVSFRDVKIKIPDRKNDKGDVNDVTQCKRGLRFEKSQLSFCLRMEELSFCLGRRRLTFGARRGLAAGAARGLGQVEKSA